MSEAKRPTLLFEEPFDSKLEFEVEQKGWCGIGIVAFPSGKKSKVFFYDPVRLSQDLETELKSGGVCIAEPCLIVIPRVTRTYMEQAVSQLYDSGYFSHD